ncbi:hypothetical protein AMELA_G00183280 [Ameiurus melas]|uniref:Epiphycan n=1 Tax=Ameiurus melas TaxID=219545 RepID=A0A7J6AB57_AMEME|nr:hypothetical protein AMELA_G00183280 [Ameiurus melas]
MESVKERPFSRRKLPPGPGLTEEPDRGPIVYWGPVDPHMKAAHALLSPHVPWCGLGTATPADVTKTDLSPQLGLSAYLRTHTAAAVRDPLHWAGPPALCISELKCRTIRESRRQRWTIMMTPCRLVLGLLVLNVVLASPPRYIRQVEPDNFDEDLDNMDIEYYDELSTDEPEIEISALSPDEDNDPETEASLEGEEDESEWEPEKESGHEEELPITPSLITPGSGVPVVLLGPDTPGGMPTCLLCTCLVGSVYCEDVKLVNVPPLSKDTTHFYARFNRITKINKSDFANMNKLKRIDLTSNAISIIEDGAFFGLPALEELVIRENSVAQLPALPVTMTLVDASHNRLGRTGIQNEAFKDMTGLLYLYLTDNGIDHIPVPLPESLRSLHLQNNNIQMIHEDTFCKRNDLSYIRRALEDIRLDGNPVNLSRTPQAYVCLPRIPVGALI